MAMVLEAFAHYVGHLLTQVAADEVGTMLGVSGEIKKMRDKLLDLEHFLADADRRNITDMTVREWVGQLKRAMYEATDILDLCQLKAMERGSSSTIDEGCFNPLLFCLRNPSHAHEIGTRIKALNKRLDAIKERSASFNFMNLGSYDDPQRSMVHASRHGNFSRETVGDFDRSGMVGEKIEEDTRALVSRIMQPHEEVNNMVVAIVGVGGIGKTSLAQKVFNDEAIQGKFSKKIWLSVNQNFSDIELLRRVIMEAGGEPGTVGIAKATLHRNLKDALIGHKTLLIMDDVWDHEAWEGMLKIPFVNAAASGSQVIITTRDEGVARGMRATLPYHHVDTLDPDDAWSLLKKQVLSSEVDEDHLETLKDTGLKIVRKCGGLPLAVKVMGGLLCKRGTLRRDWEQILDDSNWSITGMPPDLNYAVYLSYADMPPYMKQCFLYYSLLPKSRQFFLDQVVAMWVSEGFIHGNSRNLEEMGSNCYKDLISRNLIEPNKLYIDQSHCSMHDVVRSFAQYMTKDEALITDDGDKDIVAKLSSENFLRLSIETNHLQSGELKWKSLRKQQTVRTLISTIRIKINPGDSLATFSSLRTLHIESEDVAALVESLHRLKLLRYLALVDSSISVLPGNIGKMKLLQFLDLGGCKNLVNLPGSIVKLDQLRLLFLANISMIPRGFCSMTNMRKLLGFPAHMDGDWCSLGELGPLSQLRFLSITKLENVSSASFAANARLADKGHLTELLLSCTSRLGNDSLVKEIDGVSEEEQQRLEKVFDELCPPPSVETLDIKGYFGQKFPCWMISRSNMSLNNLKLLSLSDLARCIQLPNGLCQLPCLQFLQVNRAPCIRRVGTGFLNAAGVSFRRLNNMILSEMVEWEEWEWENQMKAMTCLEELCLINCKLRRVPPGLAFNARALKTLSLDGVKKLSYLENIPSLVELMVNWIPNLERITDLTSLQKLTIKNCPKLKVVERIPALKRFILEDYNRERLPEYMRGMKLRHFQLRCSIWLLSSLAGGQNSAEWDKFNQVDNAKTYAFDENITNECYVSYTRRDENNNNNNNNNNNKLDSNIRGCTVFEETLSSSMVDAQGFEHVYRMSRCTFNYICSLVRLPFLEDMRDHAFADGRVLSLQDRVAIALRMLNSGESPVTLGSSVGVGESTVSLVTQRFVDAMFKRGMIHTFWPGSAEMEKIKRKFDKNQGLLNCCGVLHTTHINFGSEDHEENDGALLQVVVDPDTRFTNIWSNQWGFFHGSQLFESCEKGTWLNGSKLNLSDGSQVGEYLIGDAGYPLRPWLLTPYLLEEKDPTANFPPYQVEFNKRHSTASSVALAAVARLKDSWKILDNAMSRPVSSWALSQIIKVCCMLHNIVIDTEGEGAPMLYNEDGPRQIAGEDAVMVRDILSQHLMESRVNTMAAKEEQEVATMASGSGGEDKEQKAFQRQKADRGKEKMHDC
uniref:Uncharacterized protein n=1 Tax=Avena sativa TaxID=4498 RepID=A0ACD5VCJ3_AVESA